MFWYWSLPFGALVVILLIDGIQKIRRNIRSARHERLFDDTYRRWREEEISSQLASRERMRLSDEQKKRLKIVDRQFLHSQGFRPLEYHKACEQVYAE